MAGRRERQDSKNKVSADHNEKPQMSPNVKQEPENNKFAMVIIKAFIFVIIALGILNIIGLVILRLTVVDMVLFANCWVSHNIGILLQIGFSVVIIAFCLYVLHRLKREQSTRPNKKELIPPVFFLKNFMYLDMNFLESFTAQRDKKFISHTVYEKGSTKSIESGKPTFTLGNIFANFSLAPSSKTKTSIEKEIRSMQERDNMLDDFLNSRQKDGTELVKKIYSKSRDNAKSIGHELDKSVGKYIHLETYFDFISLSRLEALVSLEMQYFYLELEKPNKSEKKLSIEKIKHIQKIQKYILRLRTLIPFDSFLTTENALILIEKNPLREADNQIGYKFNSTDMTVIGKVYKKIGVPRGNSALTNRILDNIQELAIFLLRELGIIKGNLDIFMIAPIAIYSKSEQEILREPNNHPIISPDNINGENV